MQMVVLCENDCTCFPACHLRTMQVQHAAYHIFSLDGLGLQYDGEPPGQNDGLSGHLLCGEASSLQGVAGCHDLPELIIGYLRISG